MKTAFKSTDQNLSTQQQRSYRKRPRFVIALLVLLASCGKENAPPGNPDNTLVCKNRPSQILFGRDMADFEYNSKYEPVKLTVTAYSPVPSQPPMVTVYTIRYNADGKADQVTRSVNSQPEVTYRMEYNSGGQLIKQSMFNALGVLTETSMAEYDNSNTLTKLITDSKGGSLEVTSVYGYLNGNLVTKSMENLYDSTSKEFYNADYSYTYFEDKENKTRSYFEGPLGLLFISNASNQPSLQYFPGKLDYQLFFARETSAEKKMLKNVQIIAHRYNTQDTTNIDYSYQYDADGFPTTQNGSYKGVTRRYEPTPFGVPVLLVTPHENSFERTMNFSCN
ncbi:MAG: hypothetical protein EOO05_16985 [Chitinophagaceae bacterium]|nr:MAG: hypothetical protein EOO05_16985 [Chitinophagaceae bacterium]